MTNAVDIAILAVLAPALRLIEMWSPIFRPEPAPADGARRGAGWVSGTGR
ncbi:MAG: hypothetical protein HY240_08715 [Actinobacteria bacterium]|nr:hypothetical protein [Actinomycetota bacterium]